MPSIDNGYPVVFRFNVKFFGISGEQNHDVSFQEVTGLSVEVETEPVKEGGENRYTHILPVRTKYTNITLKRGLLKESGIITWCKNAIENFDFKPKNLTIELLNENSETIVSWNVVNAFPVKWTFSNLDAMKNELLLETLTLAYSYFIFNAN